MHGEWCPLLLLLFLLSETGLFYFLFLWTDLYFYFVLVTELPATMLSSFHILLFLLMEHGELLQAFTIKKKKLSKKTWSLSFNLPFCCTLHFFWAWLGVGMMISRSDFILDDTKMFVMFDSVLTESRKIFISISYQDKMWHLRFYFSWEFCAPFN